jgi:hypothetical protein
MIVNGDMSSATLSAVINVDKPNVCVQATISDASGLTGAFKLQATASSDLANATWDDITGTSTAISANGTTTYNISGVGYNGIKFLYTKSGGSGTLNVNSSQN